MADELAWYTLLGFILLGFCAAEMVCVFVLLSYRWHRKAHEALGIEHSHAAETSGLAAIIGLQVLWLGGLEMIAIARQDMESILALSTLTWLSCVWSWAASDVPVLLPAAVAFPTLAANCCCCYGMYGDVTDWGTWRHPLWIFLIVNSSSAFVMAVIALHWRTREDLIVKVTKAEKVRVCQERSDELRSRVYGLVDV